MSYLLIENNGEMELAGLRLLGASSKRDDSSKIGKFGTGSKYALAVAMRHGWDVQVFRGLTPVKVETRPESFRGTTYQELCIDGIPTSITTEAGVDWEPWFIIRELYCNALDEDGANLTIKDTIQPEEGKTKIYIRMTEEVQDIYANWDECFAFNRSPLMKCPRGAVYTGSDAGLVYRMGIRVFRQTNFNWLYHYDLIDLPITEARTPGSDFRMNLEIEKMWKMFATSQMVKDLCRSQDKVEYNMSWSYCHVPPTQASNGWLCLQGFKIIPMEYGAQFTDELQRPHVVLPANLCKWLEGAYPQLDVCKLCTVKGSTYIVKEKTDKQRMLIADALGFLKDSFPEIMKCNVLVAEMDKDLLGTVDDNAIILSTRVFSLGRREITATLLEEYAHYTTDCLDETRYMQNVLINFVINSIETHKGIVL